MLKMNYAPITKLMVVAHPDDELLFGGTQLFEPGWKVVCVTNGGNKTRSIEFSRLMQELNCAYEMWDFVDNYSLPLDPKVAEELQKTLAGKSYQKVLTHNKDGEYGHPHHIQIHEILAKMSLPLWVFDKGEPLADDLWRRKRDLFRFYPSQKTVCLSFEERARLETIRKWDDKESSSPV
jgi:hypothetical protein